MKFRSAQPQSGLGVFQLAPVCAAAAVMSLAAPTAVRAADAKQGAANTRSNELREFSIPAQPLSNALIAFGEQAGIQFSLGTDQAEGKRSTALTGRYRIQQALGLL